MKTLHTAFFVSLAVTAVAVMYSSDSGEEPVADAYAGPVIKISEKPMDDFLSIQDPVIEKKRLSAPAQISMAADPVLQERAVPPVQPIEERGDAMLFEAEALGFMPFDQAVTMPFE